MFLSACNESFEIIHRKLKVYYGDDITNRSTDGRLVVRLKSTVARESLGDSNKEDRAFGNKSKQHKSIVVRWPKQTKPVEAYWLVGRNM